MPDQAITLNTNNSGGGTFSSFPSDISGNSAPPTINQVAPPAVLTTPQPGTRVDPPKIVELPPTSAKGLNKVTTKFIGTVKDIDRKCTDILLGKPASLQSNKKRNPLDYGVKPTVDLLASIDLCNIINYLFNQIPGAKKFNPTDQSERNTTLGRIKYDIQYSAYTIQKYIDGYYSENMDLLDQQDPDNVNKLQEIINKISQTLSTINGPDSEQLFTNPELNSAFPAMSSYGNFMQNVQQTFGRYTDLRNIPQKDFQKVVQYVEKTKQTCLLIQAINTPSSLITFADTFLNGQIGDQLQRLNRLIDPKKIQNLIKSVKTGCEKIKTVVDAIIKIIGFVRTIINLAVVLINIIKIIVKFLVVLPVPNMFTIIGNSTSAADAKVKIDEKANYFLDRISEINRILGAIYSFCVNRSSQLQSIISSLNIVIINLQNCNQTDAPIDADVDLGSNEINTILEQLQSSVSTLQTATTNMDNFVAIYDNNKKKNKNKFGEFTIEILQEQLTDEGIQLKRRYGVGIDKNATVVVSSTPTFASDDNIIIQEVKLLLAGLNGQSSGQRISVFSSENIESLTEAMNYLESEPVSLDDIDSFNLEAGLDDPDNEDEDSEEGLGLNAFINNLKGGKRLRRRMRRQMAQQKRQLVTELRKTDPTGRLTAKKTKKETIEAIKNAIAASELTIKINRQDIILIIAASKIPTPPTVALIVMKKREIEQNKKRIAIMKVELTKENPDISVIDASIASAVKTK
jgi:hypothetical protein